MFRDTASAFGTPSRIGKITRRALALRSATSSAPKPKLSFDRSKPTHLLRVRFLLALSFEGERVGLRLRRNLLRSSRLSRVGRTTRRPILLKRPQIFFRQLVIRI